MMAKKYGYAKKRKSSAAGAVIVLVLALAVLGLVLARLFPQIGDWLGGREPNGDPINPESSAVTTTTTTTAVKKYYITTDDLNMRSGPGTEYEVLGVLPAGEVVEVLDTENGWYRISLTEGTAYISAEFTTLSTDSGSTTTTTTTGTTTTTTGAGPSDEVYLDKDGLLQYKADGRYVQAESYTSAADVPWNLLLVNDWNAIPADHTEDKLVQILGNAGYQRVDQRMLEDLQAMLDAGKAYNIGVQSGYRSVAKQKELYWRQVDKQTSLSGVQAQVAAGKIVKRPGYSEHHTGLAVDLYGSGDYSLTETFENTEAFRWLIENCADYGFVLRFPKGKETITGVIYEPWHYRYVGKEAAKEMMEKDLCLEEYLQEKKQ